MTRMVLLTKEVDSVPMKKGNIERKVYYSPAEWTVVQRKAAACGMRPGTYIRIMSVQGEIKFYDNENYKMLINAVRSVSNSMNQIAKVVNSTGSVFAKDIETLREQFELYSTTVEQGMADFRCQTLV